MFSSSTESVGKDLKEKLAFAIKQVEAQRKELEQIRIRLENRRHSMFDATVRAIEKSDEMRARILAGEHVELQKICRVVNTSELALLNVSVRLETIRDVGDVMFVLSKAFKAVRKIEKSVSDIAPHLERSATEMNESLSGIITELGIISPDIRIALTDSPSEIFDKAQALISERTSELSELPKSIQVRGESVFEETRKVALLATEGEEDAEDEEEFKPVLLSATRSDSDYSETGIDTENAVRNYLKETTNKAGNINVVDASAQLNLPVDLVEQAYIKVLAEQRFNAESAKAPMRASKSDSSANSSGLQIDGS